MKKSKVNVTKQNCAISQNSWMLVIQLFAFFVDCSLPVTIGPWDDLQSGSL